MDFTLPALTLSSISFIRALSRSRASCTGLRRVVAMPAIIAGTRGLSRTIDDGSSELALLRLVRRWRNSGTRFHQDLGLVDVAILESEDVLELDRGDFDVRFIPMNPRHAINIILYLVSCFCPRPNQRKNAMPATATRMCQIRSNAAPLRGGLRMIQKDIQTPIKLLCVDWSHRKGIGSPRLNHSCCRRGFKAQPALSGGVKPRTYCVFP